jgi:hypothetical protein
MPPIFLSAVNDADWSTSARGSMGTIGFPLELRPLTLNIETKGMTY